MIIKSDALKAGIGYTLGNVFIKGINFLTLPIFSRIMLPDEFGVYSVFLSYDAILTAVIGLAMHSSVRSANYEFPKKLDAYVSSISIIYWICGGILFGASLLFRETIASIIGLRADALLFLMPLSFASAVIHLYNERASLDYAYKRYLGVSFINSLGNVSVSLVLILTVFRTNQAVGRIAGTTIIAFALAIFILLSFYRKSRPAYNKEYWRFAVRYSLPIVPHGISQTLLAQCDRIMISSIIGAAEAGIYSLAANLKLIVTVVSTSISTAWSTWFYECMEKKAFKEIQKRAVQLVSAFLAMTVCLMALSPELVLLLGGAEYAEGKWVAVPMLVDAFLLFLYNVIVPSEYYSKKTNYIMMGTLIAAGLNIVLNYVCISKYGYIAAAYTTLAAYMVYLCLHLVISYKLVKFSILPTKWLMFYGIVVAVAAAINLIFMESVIIRYSACFITIVGIALVVIKYRMRPR